MAALSSVIADLRYAIRTLLHRPLFSATAVLTLALGIGVNAVAFSAINGVLMKPGRLADARELGWILVKAPGNAYGAMSLPDFEDVRRTSRTFDSIAAEARVPLSVRTDRGVETAWTLLVSSEYLTMLRARPWLGRVFTSADLPHLPAVVSERYWREHLGGGDSVAGRTIVVNGHSFSIVGVLPEGFQGPGGFFEPSIWLPLERVEVLGLAQTLRGRHEAWLGVAGRMKKGVSYADAEADLQSIARRLAADYPAVHQDWSISFAPVVYGNPQVRGLAPYAWIALGVVGIVLVIACFNVAGLLLARATERQRELSVRAALGASRVRILRQLLTEGLVLAIVSGAMAVVVANWSGDLLAAFSLPSPIPQRVHMPVDWRLVGFTAALAAIAGILPAVIPAWQATAANLLGALKRESAIGGRPSRVRNAFILAQIAGSTLFLAAALLFVRSFANIVRFDTGFEVAHTLTVEVTPSMYGYDTARTGAFVGSALERLVQVPGVEAVGIGERAPFAVGFPKRMTLSAAGEDCAVVTCRTAIDNAIGRGYFSTLGLPIVEGRDFTEIEIRSGGGVIVSAAMAADLWPDGSAVGRWLRPFATAAQPDATPLQVIGVAADVRQGYFAEKPGWMVYRPLRHDDLTGRLTFVMRTTGDPRLSISQVHQQLHAIDPNVPPYIRTMPQRMEMPLWPARTAAGFLVVCGSLALVLAAVGLFGVTYYAVSQRTREFGVRVALGATPRSVMSLVLKEGLVLTIPGVVLGIAAALAATRLVANLLFGVSPADPVTYATTAVLQTAVALAACALPAYRATTADPLVALRQE